MQIRLKYHLSQSITNSLSAHDHKSPQSSLSTKCLEVYFQNLLQWGSGTQSRGAVPKRNSAEQCACWAGVQENTGGMKTPPQGLAARPIALSPQPWGNQSVLRFGGDGATWNILEEIGEIRQKWWGDSKCCQVLVSVTLNRHSKSGRCVDNTESGGLARWVHTVPPEWAHTGAWGQRTKAGGPRRMLEETVLAEVRTTGAMDHDAAASLWVYTGTQTRGLGKAGSVEKRDKGKTLTLQITMCRRNQKIRKPSVPIPKAMVDSRKDSQWDWKDSDKGPRGWRHSIWNYHPHVLLITDCAPRGWRTQRTHHPWDPCAKNVR